MTAAEQLAEMAERATGHAMNPWKVVDRLNEYRAVLRWFAEEVERRAKVKCVPPHNPRDPCDQCRGRFMTQLLKEIEREEK